MNRLRALVLLTSLGANLAFAGPVVEVAGRKLPVLTEEPTADELTYLAPAGSDLAKKLAQHVLTYELDAEARAAHHVERLPEGSPSLVRVHRVGKRFFLYSPCDWMNRSLTVITKDTAWLAGTELFVLPITAKATKARVTTYTLDTSHAPPFIAGTLVLRAGERAGHFEVLGEGGKGSEDLMTFAEAARLDVVAQRCVKAKVPEFDFTRAGGVSSP